MLKWIIVAAFFLLIACSEETTHCPVEATYHPKAPQIDSLWMESQSSFDPWNIILGLKFMDEDGNLPSEQAPPEDDHRFPAPRPRSIWPCCAAHP